MIIIIQINFESLKNTMLIFEERIFTNKKKKKKEERNVSNLRHIESYRTSVPRMRKLNSSMNYPSLLEIFV